MDQQRKDMVKALFIRKPRGDHSEEKMKAIIKNVRDTANPIYSKSKLLGLCRVSFFSTYGTHFQESVKSLDTLWDESK